MTTPPFSTDVSGDSVLRFPEHGMTTREARVSAALRKLNPILADLLHQALDTSSIPDREAYAGIAAHAAR